MRGFLMVAFLALLPGSALAAPACSTWTAELQEDEGGEVMTARACALDAPDIYMQLTCGSGTVSFRYDPAYGSDTVPSFEDEQPVTFTFSDSSETLAMRYEEMDGMLAAYMPPDAAIIGKLRAESSLEIGAVGGYPAHRFGLSGSSKALDTLVAGCR
jgi:hypothetical protein